MKLKSLSTFAAIVAAGVLPLFGPVGLADAQPVGITFKYVPRPGDNFVRVFLPGDFNGWGPNSGGLIAPNATSKMTYDEELDMWLYNQWLPAGDVRQYKIHFHLNDSGTQFLWISDPTNPETNPEDNNNSVLRVADPMIFQMDQRVNDAREVIEVSAGIFGNSDIVSITFAINGDSASGLEYFDADKGIFAYALPSPAPGNSLFGLTVVDAIGDTVRAAIGTLPIEVEDRPRPAGIADGINYDPIDATQVTLSLFAPRKQHVYAIGDFNDWATSPEFLMKRDSLNEDSVNFWITIDGLDPGREYAFQYLIDGQIRLGDPFSHKILDPLYDGEIGSAYPDLKPYPEGKTEYAVSVIQTAQQAYDWEVEDFDRPPNGELIIYELLVRDFIANHDYATLIDTLDYLERLGVNAIELMPVAEFSGNSSWGYEPDFHLAPDKYYGPARDLKRFIDACHQRGFAVLLDVVYNHNAYNAPFSRMYSASPTGAPAASPLPTNPWLNTVPRHPFNVFNDVNHESSATKYWLDRANEYWLTEFNVDGFRFDLSKGFTQTDTGNDIAAWGRYDASRIRLLKRMADHIWEIDSTAIVILEHFAEDSEERELAGYGMDQGYPGMLIWNNINHAYSEATMAYNRGSNSNFQRAYFGEGGRGWPMPHVISYMESHDEQWLMFKNLAFGACAASPFGGNRCNEENAGYNTRDIPIALDRMKMAGAFFLTLPGPKMIWQFGELGYGFGPDGRDCLRPNDTEFGDCPSGTPGRTKRKPIRWDYREDALRWKLYKTWSELLRLRSEHEVLRDPATRVEMDLDGNVKRLTLHHSEMSVAIMGNFGVSGASGAFLDLAAGEWYDFFKGGKALAFEDPEEELTLAPGEFLLLTSVPVEPAEEGLITVAVEDGYAVATPGTFELTSFPNPFSSGVSLVYSIPIAGHVRIEIYDILGRHVETVVDEAHAAGRHERRIATGSFPPGLYFVRAVGSKGYAAVPLMKVGAQ